MKNKIVDLIERAITVIALFYFLGSIGAVINDMMTAPLAFVWGLATMWLIMFIWVNSDEIIMF